MTFWAAALSVNLYALPLDYFGAARAGSGVAALTFAYGLMTTALAWGGGAILDRSGWHTLCAGIAVFPLVSYFILRGASRTA